MFFFVFWDFYGFRRVPRELGLERILQKLKRNSNKNNNGLIDMTLIKRMICERLDPKLKKKLVSFLASV